MSIEAIKRELTRMDENQRKQIVAFALAIDDEKNAEYRSELAAKIDDSNPANWATLEEFDSRVLGNRKDA